MDFSSTLELTSLYIYQISCDLISSNLVYYINCINNNIIDHGQARNSIKYVIKGEGHFALHCDQEAKALILLLLDHTQAKFNYKSIGHMHTHISCHIIIHTCIIVHATLKPYHTLPQNQLQATDSEHSMVSCAHMSQSNRT